MSNTATATRSIKREYIFRYLLLFLSLVAWIEPSSSVLFGISPTQKNIGAGKPRPRSKDAYTLRITSSYQEHGLTHVALNNGSIWTLQTPLLWLVGDEVYLTNDLEGGWVMRNESDRSSTGVRFVRLLEQKVPRISSITNAGGEIALDDGSIWRIDLWERLWGHTFSWQVGDHIIISPLPVWDASRSHLLIDVDRKLQRAAATLLYR